MKQSEARKRTHWSDRMTPARTWGAASVVAGLFLAAGWLAAQQQTYYFASSDYDYGTFYDYDMPEQSAWDQEKADSERRRQDRLASKRASQDQARAERAERDAAKQQDLDSRKDELRAVPGSGSPMVFGYENPTVDQLIDSRVYAREQARRAADAAPSLPKGAAPAAGLTAVGVGNTTYYYGDGQFYLLEGETRKPVEAPVSAMVFSVPDDSKKVAVEGATLYEVKGAYYQRVMFAGRVMYEVVPKPEGA